MSSMLRRARAPRRVRTISSRLRRILWRFIRGVFVLAAALGPGMPPPPPPAPHPIEQVEGESGSEQD